MNLKTAILKLHPAEARRLELCGWLGRASINHPAINAVRRELAELDLKSAFTAGVLMRKCELALAAANFSKGTAKPEDAPCAEPTVTELYREAAAKINGHKLTTREFVELVVKEHPHRRTEILKSPSNKLFELKKQGVLVSEKRQHRGMGWLWMRATAGMMICVGLLTGCQSPRVASGVSPEVRATGSTLQPTLALPPLPEVFAPQVSPQMPLIAAAPPATWPQTNFVTLFASPDSPQYTPPLFAGVISNRVVWGTTNGQLSYSQWFPPTNKFVIPIITLQSNDADRVWLFQLEYENSWHGMVIPASNIAHWPAPPPVFIGANLAWGSVRPLKVDYVATLPPTNWTTLTSVTGSNLFFSARQMTGNRFFRLTAPSNTPVPVATFTPVFTNYP